jgi:predicted aspartyl protease
LGTFHWPLTVLSVDGTREETIDALVDTGASYTLLPSVMLRRMGVVPQRRLEFELANGEIMEHDVGEARIRIDGVEATSIVVFGDDAASPRLGADALQSVSMVVDPVNKSLAPTRALLMSPVARHTGAS